MVNGPAVTGPVLAELALSGSALRPYLLLICFAWMITIAYDKQIPAGCLGALAHPTRARIVEMLASRPHTAGEIHGAFPIAAPAVSRHLRVLRQTGLVEERRPDADRRVRLYALRPEPLDELAAWLAAMSGGWRQQLDAFKDYVGVRAGGDGGKR